MIITKISGQIKNPNRASIFVDNKYSFSLNLEQLLETKLKVGNDIDEPKLKKFKKLSDDGKLKMRALEWLMIRPRSAKELKNYLTRKGLDQEAIIDWIKYFQDKDYQNDKHFTKWWIEQRLLKNRSRAHIKFELKTKGIKNEIITAMLEDTVVDDKGSLKDLIVKKRRLTKYQDDKKLTEYLLRQGFRYSLIKEVFAE